MSNDSAGKAVARTTVPLNVGASSATRVYGWQVVVERKDNLRRLGASGMLRDFFSALTLAAITGRFMRSIAPASR